MLESRLATDPLARARLSHAIRANTSESNELSVASTNLDELARRPLPGIPQQLVHLAQWVASRLGDDSLGRVPSPALDLLAGVVGAVDGDRVQRLIAHASRQGFLEFDEASNTLGLSAEGWALVKNPKGELPQDELKPTSDAASTDIVSALCNKCGGDRRAYKRASHTVTGHDDETSWSDTFDVLECCGCSGISVRHELWFSEWDQFDEDPITGNPRMIPGVKVEYWPPPTKRKKPDWAERLDDGALRGVFGEVYQALNLGLMALASIGTRTLLDRAMHLRVGDPRGGFGAKLSRMVERGHIGADEQAILEVVTDAGSAAAHRGYTPNAKTLDTIVETVENFLQREFVLKTASGEIRAATPPRRTTVKP
jgi:hypothetical protein